MSIPSQRVNIILIENEPANYDYVFDANKKDLKEKIGYFFLKAHHTKNGYCKVSSISKANSETIAKTNSVIIKIICILLECLCFTLIGKKILSISKTHEKNIQKLQICIKKIALEKLANESKKKIEDASSSTGEDTSSGKTPDQKTLGQLEDEIKTSSDEDTSLIKGKDQIDEKTLILNNNFNLQVEQWSYLEGLLTEYQLILSSRKSLSKGFSRFLMGELAAIESSVKALSKQNSQFMLDLDIKKTKEQAEEIEQIHQLNQNIEQLINLYQNLKNELEKQISPSQVTGFVNQGNSCYMNAALQPLLATHNFPDLVPKEIKQIPGEAEDHFEGRKKILSSFHELIEAYQTKDTQNSKVLGKLVGKLRAIIFEVGLDEGEFRTGDNKFAMHDAGVFFDLIIQVMRKGFTLRNEKIYKLNNSPKKTVVDSQYRGVLYFTPQGKIQDSIDNLGKEIQDQLSQEDAFRYQDESTGAELKLTQYTEKTLIVEQPPEILVLGSRNGYGLDQGYRIDVEHDLIVDFKSLFDSQQVSGSQKYELVGFSQNHHHVHWTSVVYQGEGNWKNCNDSVVQPISASEIAKKQANFLVYRKINA